jgi:hypothetical protein
LPVSDDKFSISKKLLIRDFNEVIAGEWVASGEGGGAADGSVSE